MSCHFDATTNKHWIDVTFSETVSHLIIGPGDVQYQSADAENPSEDNAACLRADGEDDAGESAGKKSWGSGGPLLPTMLILSR
jgi:hypothetical protein